MYVDQDPLLNIMIETMKIARVILSLRVSYRNFDYELRELTYFLWEVLFILQMCYCKYYNLLHYVLVRYETRVTTAQ